MHNRNKGHIIYKSSQKTTLIKTLNNQIPFLLHHKRKRKSISETTEHTHS